MNQQTVPGPVDPDDRKVYEGLYDHLMEFMSLAFDKSHYVGSIARADWRARMKKNKEDLLQFIHMHGEE